MSDHETVPQTPQSPSENNPLHTTSEPVTDTLNRDDNDASQNFGENITDAEPSLPGEEENLASAPLATAETETEQPPAEAETEQSDVPPDSNRRGFLSRLRRTRKNAPEKTLHTTGEEPADDQNGTADDTSAVSAVEENPAEAEPSPETSENVDEENKKPDFFAAVGTASASTAELGTDNHDGETLFDGRSTTGQGDVSSSPKKYVGKTFVEAAELAFAAGYIPKFYNALTGIPYTTEPPPDGSIVIRVAQNGTAIHFYCNPNRLSSTPFAAMQDSSTDTVKKRKKTPLRIAAIAAAVIVGLLLATGTGLFIMTKVKEAAKVSVPNVVTQTVPDATKVLSASDTTLGQITEISSASIGKGTILNQTPTAGTKVAKGAPVNIIVSSGPQQNTVPKLTGLTQEQATATLKAVNFTVGAVTLKDDPAPAGTVIGQNPLPDTKMSENTAVDLILSNGKTAIPNVIGKNLEDASVTLATAGFKVKPVPITQEGPAGVIVGQTPPAATLTEKGAEIQIVYTTPPVVATPAPTTPTTPTTAPPAVQLPAPATPTPEVAAPQ